MTQKTIDNWSELQSIEILEFTRRFIFLDDHRPLFFKNAGIEKGDTVVDLGCGSGALTRYIGKGLEGDGKAIGIDLDEKYINYANKKAKEKNMENTVSFQKGDVYHLPFEDESIDAVTDHTLLINLQAPNRCIKESLRVLKSGGSISTLTFMWGYFPPNRLNFAKPEFKELFETQMKLYKIQKDFMPKGEIGANDYNVYSIMQRYKDLGIEEVQINAFFPIFSPDDARYLHLRRDWLKEMYELNKWEIQQYMDKEEQLKQYGITKKKLQDTLKVLEERYLYEKENTSWIFFNGIEMLISGKKTTKQ
ncbi:MAG: class I SAM-dependent methyltransferase [bacterium]|nr:class I SAM-dependent methyltransferase [bacterium]